MNCKDKGYFFLSQLIIQCFITNRLIRIIHLLNYVREHYSVRKYIPTHLLLKPATYTGNWCRQLRSGTSQAGWRLRIARRHRGIRRWALTEGYNYTQGSQGNLLFFHYKSQEDKDLQEREGGLFAVSFSEKSSLPLPK